MIKQGKLEEAFDELSSREPPLAWAFYPKVESYLKKTGWL
jgi:hypothetical protein